MSAVAKYRYLTPEAVAKFKNMNLIARHVVEGFISGLHKSPYRGFSIEFAEHRKYTVGDNPRYVDWQVYGRTDRFYIKEFEQETNLKAYIVLDKSASMGYAGGDGITKLQYSCYLAAVLAYMLVRQQDS